MEQAFKYIAFISYKREDEKRARWMQRKLEGYRLPSVIAKEKPYLPRKFDRVCRDFTDFEPNDLTELLKQKLLDSQYLIVICSPLSARSEWVGKEIQEFIKQGKKDKIILFIIDGEPYSKNPERECYHPIIRNELPEMLGANIHEKGKESKYIKRERAFIRVVSALLKVSFDSLWQRQKRRIIKRRITTLALIFLIIALLIGVSFYQEKANQPFEVRISLLEVTPRNSNLPFENGRIYLCYDNDTLVSKYINRYDDVAEFAHIPGKYRGKPAKVWFDMVGYEKQSSVLTLAPSIIQSISRDDTYGIIKGRVLDFNGNPISNATIAIGDKEISSNSKGLFEVRFDFQEQSVTKEVIVKRSGYKLYKGCYTMGKNWQIVLEED